MHALDTSDIGCRAKLTGCWRMHLPYPGPVCTWRRPDGTTQADILVWQLTILKGRCEHSWAAVLACAYAAYKSVMTDVSCGQQEAFHGASQLLAAHSPCAHPCLPGLIPGPTGCSHSGPFIGYLAAFMFCVSCSPYHVVDVHAQVAEQVAEMLLQEALSSSSAGELWKPDIGGR